MTTQKAVAGVSLKTQSYAFLQEQMQLKSMMECPILELV